MKIILGTFKDSADELGAFLEPRLGAKPLVGGGEITFDDDKVKKTVKARHVKTYIKRFLLKNDERENYRILVEGKELRLIELERDEEEEEESKKGKEQSKEREAEKEEEPAAEEKAEEEQPAQPSEKPA